MQPSEQQVVQGLLEGEEWAYHYVFQVFYQPMCILANAILKDDFQAQATVSDVISHLYEIRKDLQIRSKLKSYLMMSTRNACLNLLKTKVARTEQSFSSLQVDEVRDIFSGSDRVTPQGRLLDRELYQLMSQRIAHMPEPTKTTFIKSKFRGMTYREIAAEEGISANTVKFRVKNALKYLEQHFHTYLDVFLVFFAISLSLGGLNIVLCI